MDIEKLLMKAEAVDNGELLVGFVCCCKNCTTKPYGEELKLDRPYALMTDKDSKWGNVLVYTDTMQFANT